MSENGLLGVTQQLSELGHESKLSPDKHNEHRPSGHNPFSYTEIPAVPYNSPVKPLEQEARNGDNGGTQVFLILIIQYFYFRANLKGLKFSYNLMGHDVNLAQNV